MWSENKARKRRGAGVIRIKGKSKEEWKLFKTKQKQYSESELNKYYQRNFVKLQTKT